MFLDFRFFFHESVSPEPHSIPWGPFQIFTKIHARHLQDAYKDDLSNLSGVYILAHFVFHVVINSQSSCYFILPVNIFPVSLIPAINTKLLISQRIFGKNLNGPNRVLRSQGLGKLICEKT